LYTGKCEMPGQRLCAAQAHGREEDAMFDDLMEKKEKKVEYIELIYDLIFVYVIGRNNSLLHNFSDGFVEFGAFMAYLMTTLAVIQIWNYSSYYINVYGRNSVRDHVFFFINMFLLYFIGEGTRADWQGFHVQYHVAWALILINIGMQYVIEYRNHSGEPIIQKQIRRLAAVLFAEAAAVAADIIIYKTFQTSWLSLAAILVSMTIVTALGHNRGTDYIDFPHLSERAMLYVVFTFGEMIIAIASFFDGAFSFRSTYFALAAFLIVVALFLSYEVFYDHIIDREMQTNGLVYMLLHIFIIFSMNNITNGLEFMREEEIDLIPKLTFLIMSFILFFGTLFLIGLGHAKARFRKTRDLFLSGTAIGLVFILLMFLFRENMVVNIAVSLVFVYVMFWRIYRYGDKIRNM